MSSKERLEIDEESSTDQKMWEKKWFWVILE